MDTQEVGAELHRLADTDPLDPMDAHALLARGRRGRRRRRLFSAGAGIAAVAAVAVPASLMPNLDSGRPPGVAGSSTPATTKAVPPDFTAVPGVPRGEAGAALKVSYAEATRLCALRYPQYKRPIQRNSFWYTGYTVLYELQRGDKAAQCTIPGGDKPSTALVAAARRDPMPATAAARLRNCSVVFWTDVTKWRVMASDTSPQRATNLIAVSPSGRKAVRCTLVPKFDDTAALGSGPGVFSLAGQVRQVFDNDFAQFGMGYAQGCTGCETKYYDGFGRVASNIARIRIAPAGSRNTHDITVTDGWYAVSWLDPDPHGSGKYTLTAYDKTGKVLKTVHN
ncbi:hypothetical protein E0H73_40685 [Kribbella pittospori]|uniref:Uncharacterized protein n=1 Tax=Kribbella pittospori TaxID=722689 RepID=A0A4R0JYE8_9ACTN|nr:hypothetical protein [Kribbella pittospori]TCC51880.1 hypothetical protein E0H73_40685 [Kribbella pittospori]